MKKSLCVYSSVKEAEKEEEEEMVYMRGHLNGMTKNKSLSLIRPITHAIVSACLHVGIAAAAAAAAALKWLLSINSCP